MTTKNAGRVAKKYWESSNCLSSRRELCDGFELPMASYPQDFECLLTRCVER